MTAQYLPSIWVAGDVAVEDGLEVVGLVECLAGAPAQPTAVATIDTAGMVTTATHCAQHIMCSPGLDD